MKQTFRESRDFFVLFFIWLVIGGIILLLTEKLDLHLKFNSYNHPITDEFFKYATYLGDGIFAGFIALLVFFYKVRYGVVAVISFAGAGLLAQLLKRQVFSDFKRPSKVFEQIADLHFIDGVNLHTNFSFPSGHATVAFSIFFLLGFISRNRLVEVFCFIMAFLVAFSRVYISQHFFEDIYAGSILGTTFTFLVISWFNHKSWGSDGLLAKFDKK